MSSSRDEKCHYKNYKCSNIRYRDYKFCFEHILEDSSSPFTACQYVSNSTKRLCHNPATHNTKKNSSVSLCHIHNSQDKDSITKDLTTVYQTNFNKSKWIKNNNKHDIKYKQGSEINVESNTKWLIHDSPVWKIVDPDIDVDSYEESDDLLKYADIMTVEEVVLLSKEKLVKLQSAYINQFKHLTKVLSRKRSEYLSSTNLDADTDFNGKLSDKERAKLTSLQALNNLHRHNGEGMLLHMQSKRRKMDNSGTSTSKQTKNRCSYVENHTRCKHSCLPYTKYCLTHILEDPLQILYKKCEKCGSPVSSVTNLFEESGYCSMHQHLDDLTFGNSDLENINKLAVVETPTTSSNDINLSEINEVEKMEIDQHEIDNKIENVEEKCCAELDEITPLPDTVPITHSPKTSHMEPNISDPQPKMDNAELKVNEPEPIPASTTPTAARKESTTNSLDILGIGEVYAMSSISYTDIPEQAIQLTPLGKNSGSHVLQVQKNERSENVSTQESVTEIQHGGAIMSVTKIVPENAGSKMAAGITLVPPVFVAEKPEKNLNFNNNSGLNEDQQSQPLTPQDKCDLVSEKLESNNPETPMCDTGVDSDKQKYFETEEPTKITTSVKDDPNTQTVNQIKANSPEEIAKEQELMEKSQIVPKHDIIRSLNKSPKTTENIKPAAPDNNLADKNEDSGLKLDNINNLSSSNNEELNEPNSSSSEDHKTSSMDEKEAVASLLSLFDSS